MDPNAHVELNISLPVGAPGANKKARTTLKPKWILLFLLPGSETCSGGIGEELQRRKWGVWGHGQPASLCHTLGTNSRQWGRATAQYIYTSPFPLTQALSSRRRPGINTDIGGLSSFLAYLLCLKPLPPGRSVLQLIYLFVHFNCRNWTALFWLEANCKCVQEIFFPPPYSPPNTHNQP